MRPDPQVLWPRHGVKPTDAARASPHQGWEGWDGFYHRSDKGGGRGEFRRPPPNPWKIAYPPLGLTFQLHATSFKHTGLFPEQAVNWEWFSAKIKTARAAGREVSVLNLFGYTGAATVAAAAGASVCHVDASEGMVRWCRENAALNGLADGSDPLSGRRLPEIRDARARSAAGATTRSSWIRRRMAAAGGASSGNSRIIFGIY